MSYSQDFDIVLLGHFAKDIEVIVDEGVEKELLGGAVYFGALPLVAIGVKVGVVTKLAKEDFSHLSIFEEANIPVFAREASETSGMRNVHPTRKREVRHNFSIGFAGPFSIEDFPDIQAEIIHIGALRKGEVPLEVIKELATKADLALDVQGFVRVREDSKDGKLVMKDWEEKGSALSFVKYLKADATEAEVLTGTGDLRNAAKILAEMGPFEVLITHHEGVLLLADGRFYEAPFIPRSLEGRSGRGDTCMSTYLGKKIKGSPSRKAIKYAAALTTLKLEKEGPFRGNINDVEDLLESPEFSRNTEGT